MGRPLRSNMQHGLHHVMNRGVDRGLTFFEDADRVEFGRLLGEAWRRTGVMAHAYCLMPNHFHLLLECPEGGLSDYMQFLASQYTRHTNDRIGRDGPLFRGRFHSIAVDDDHYLLRATRYIHRNPLELAGVSSPELYRWSSHRAYLGWRRRPAWLRCELVLGLLGHDIDAFDSFVSGQVRCSTPMVDPRRVLSAADLIVDECVDHVARSRQGLTRTVALLVATRLGGAAGDAVLASLGLTDRKASRDAVRRARQQLVDHPGLERIVVRTIELAT